MKKTLLIMVMALALLLTQCRKPEVKFPTPSSAEGVTVSMTVTAGPGSKTDITAEGAITWSTGDKLYVGYDSKYVGCLTIVSGEGTPTGTFSGDVTLPNGTTGDQTFGFFYLGRDNGVAPSLNATTVAVSFATQEIYDNSGKLKNASKHHVGYGSAKGTVKDGIVTGINVTLVSKVALARFSFKKNSTDYTDELTLSGTNIYNSMTVGFGGSFNHGATSGSISLTGSHSERYVMLVPTGATTAQTLTFTGSAEDGTGDVPGLQANKFYGKTDAIPVTLTASAVHVTSVSLNKPSLSLEVGANETLTATVSPDNATDKSVTWNSSAPGVATVSSTGVVTAVAAGTATITVTTVDGGKTAKCEVTVTAPSYLPGEFTINSGGTKVKFSKGNLQYLGKAAEGHKWRFADHQWDYMGDGPSGSKPGNVDLGTLGYTAEQYNYGSGADGGSETDKDMESARDLFGWGATGFQDERTKLTGYQTNYQPYSTSKTAQSGTAATYNKYGYGPDYDAANEYGLSVKNKSDWGCLKIGDDPANTWRTLTSAEWIYLLNTRTTETTDLPNSSRYAKVTVNGVKGLLLFPDSFAWTSAMGTAPTATNSAFGAFNAGSYTAAEFTEQEKAGVVFLPAAGYRSGSSLNSVGSYGDYWSSACISSYGAYRMYFGSSGVSPQGNGDRYCGSSVRLVR